MNLRVLIRLLLFQFSKFGMNLEGKESKSRVNFGKITFKGLNQN